MTRIGKKPIQFGSEIKVSLEDNLLCVEGPCGKINLPVPSGFEVKISGDILEVTGKDKLAPKNIHGLFRSLVQNAVTGVKTQWTKTLELVGVVFRAQTSGSELELNLGFSHPVKISAPQGVTFKVVENKIMVIGADKYKVGEIAAIIRKFKPPEPYKGKGIRYEKEHIRKKLGKAAKAVGGAAGAK